MDAHRQAKCLPERETVGILASCRRKWPFRNQNTINRRSINPEHANKLRTADRPSDSGDFDSTGNAIPLSNA